jgi:hypothetical protein
MSQARPCPYCGAPVEPCQAQLDEDSPEICGIWECALYNDHMRNDYPSVDQETLRAREAQRAVKRRAKDA